MKVEDCYKVFDESLKEDADIFESMKQFYKLRHTDVDVFKEAIKVHLDKTKYNIVDKYGTAILYEPGDEKRPNWGKHKWEQGISKEYIEAAKKFFYWREEQKKK